MTGLDEKNIKQQLKDYEKAAELTGVSNELTTRLKYQIQSVDGNKEQSFIDNFVDNEFLALDTKAYRQYYGEVSPDIDMIFDFTTKDGKTIKVDVPLGIDFFWPAGDK
jgi:ribosomal protein S3AE